MLLLTGPEGSDTKNPKQTSKQMTKKIPAVKYKKAPQAPRRFKSSYMFFSIEKHKQIRIDLAEKGETVKPSTTDVAKMVSQAWKALSHDEREVFEDMARRDKARYEVEKTMYAGPWKVPAKKRSQKDPNAPKRPMSAFLSFSNSKRTQVKTENPDVGNAEISRILAQMWKDASEEERKEHIDKEFKLRREYKAAIAEWRKESECEMEAARKEREDEAMRTAMTSKERGGEEPPSSSNDMVSWGGYPYYHHDGGYHQQYNSPAPYGQQHQTQSLTPPNGVQGAHSYQYGHHPQQPYYPPSGQHQGEASNGESEPKPAPYSVDPGGYYPPAAPYYYHGHPQYYADQSYASQYPSHNGAQPNTSYNGNDASQGYDQSYGTSPHYSQHHHPYGQSYYGAYPSTDPNESREGAEVGYYPPPPAAHPYPAGGYPAY